MLEVRERVLGPEHPDTLTSIHNLVSVLRDQGKYTEAEAMSQQALERREKASGSMASEYAAEESPQFGISTKGDCA